MKPKSLFESGISAFLKLLAGINLISFPAIAPRRRRFSIRHDNLKRRFNIHVPSYFDKAIQLPLVIVLHGRGGNGWSMVLLTRKGFNKLADKDGFIVVYPDGVDKNWNDGRRDEEANDRAHRENIDDVGFISGLIDFMVENYNVDPGRIYVTGISNGAIMSYRLACELSPKIAAIAPVDGNIPVMLLNECRPSSSVSVLAINNIEDPVVPFDGGEIQGQFRKIKLGKVLSVEESVMFWVKHNKCSPEPVFTEEPDKFPEDGTRVKRWEYLNGNDGAEVFLYAIEGGGHTWPGGVQYLPARVIGKTSREIDANEIIWSFFKRHLRK
jgi:polyhydroxybutyrate depolymerase